MSSERSLEGHINAHWIDCVRMSLWGTGMESKQRGEGKNETFTEQSWPLYPRLPQQWWIESIWKRKLGLYEHVKSFFLSSFPK